MSEIKLTKPQRELLFDISERPKPIAAHYAPAKHLVQLGLAEWTMGRFDDVLGITRLGQDTRRALQGRSSNQ